MVCPVSSSCAVASSVVELSCDPAVIVSAYADGGTPKGAPQLLQNRAGAVFALPQVRQTKPGVCEGSDIKALSSDGRQVLLTKYHLDRQHRARSSHPDVLEHFAITGLSECPSRG